MSGSDEEGNDSDEVFWVLLYATLRRQWENKSNIKTSIFYISNAMSYLNTKQSRLLYTYLRSDDNISSFQVNNQILSWLEGLISNDVITAKPTY